MKPSMAAMSSPSSILQRQAIEVHVSGRPWRRCAGAKTSAEPSWTAAAWRIGPSPPTEQRAALRPGEPPIDLPLAQGVLPADTFHHATDGEAFLAREGGFVQRQII
jgi:hypothetical protein